MKVRIRVKGIEEARKFIKESARILSGARGRFYPQQTRIIKKAILANADPSYANSPAKEMALKSSEIWRHENTRHINDIESALFANYRQYGCGGLKPTILVEIKESDMQEMLLAAVEELNSVR